ncbi:MAG TPA: hypothetical protein VKJ83_02970 [Actinomycetota bacterium]|nr:hypothetical protein [Actinomycetota bacterium]
MNSREALYTPFMNRVALAMQTGTVSADPELVASKRRSLARAVDDWHALRGRAEHVVAEANAMLPASMPPVALCDEVGELAFTVLHGNLVVRVSLARSGAEGWVELERSWAAEDGVEPGEPSVMEDLVLRLIER